MNETRSGPYAGWVCTGCGKHIASRPPTSCHDCGGMFVGATPELLACDRCEHEDASRVLGAASEDYDRLCEGCVEWANSSDSPYTTQEV